jgi:hypothetical protein
MIVTITGSGTTLRDSRPVWATRPSLGSFPGYLICRLHLFIGCDVIGVDHGGRVPRAEETVSPAEPAPDPCKRDIIRVIGFKPG